MNTLSGSRGSVVEYRGVEVMQSGDHDDTPFHSSGTMDPVQGATKRSTPLNNISEVSKPPEAHTTQRLITIENVLKQMKILREKHITSSTEGRMSMQPWDCDDSPSQIPGNALKKNQVQDVHRPTANETKEELKLKVTTQIIILENVVINEPQEEFKLKETPQIMTQEKVVTNAQRPTANETKEELKLKATTQIIIQENVVINEPQELRLKKTPQIMTQEKVVTNAQKEAKMTPTASDSKVLDEYTIFTQGLLKEGIDIKVDKPHTPTDDNMHYNEVCRFSTKVVTVPVGSTGSKGHGTDPPYQKQITEIMKKELTQLKALSKNHEQMSTCKLRYRV
jgi:hypothetical protein